MKCEHTPNYVTGAWNECVMKMWCIEFQQFKTIESEQWNTIQEWETRKEWNQGCCFWCCSWSAKWKACREVNFLQSHDIWFQWCFKKTKTVWKWCGSHVLPHSFTMNQKELILCIILIEFNGISSNEILFPFFCVRRQKGSRENMKSAKCTNNVRFFSHYIVDESENQVILWCIFLFYYFVWLWFSFHYWIGSRQKWQTSNDSTLFRQQLFYFMRIRACALKFVFRYCY